MKLINKLKVWYFKFSNPPLHIMIPTLEDLRVINIMFEMLGCWKKEEEKKKK